MASPKTSTWCSLCDQTAAQGSWTAVSEGAHCTEALKKDIRLL